MDKFRNKYRIQSTRLQNWDYGSNAMYFVTICTQDRNNYFGRIENGLMVLSEIGEIVRECWQNIPNHFPFVKLDESVVMPNHFHGIIIIDKMEYGQNEMDGLECGRIVVLETQNFASLQQQPTDQNQSNNKFGPQSQNLASIIRGFKTGVTKYARNNNIDFGWQPRYHDHIIRNDNEYQRIKKYIIDNPVNWNENTVRRKEK